MRALPKKALQNSLLTLRDLALTAGPFVLLALALLVGAYPVLQAHRSAGAGLGARHAAAGLIALPAIPVSIIITALVYKYFGLSIITMTLGGREMAISGLVDDAVVGVENVLRRLKEDRAKPPKPPKHPMHPMYPMYPMYPIKIVGRDPTSTSHTSTRKGGAPQHRGHQERSADWNDLDSVKWPATSAPHPPPCPAKPCRQCHRH